MEFRLQESYEQRISRVRADVESGLEEAFQKRRQDLDAKFKMKAENFRRETEHKFLEELKKVCEFISKILKYFSYFVVVICYVLYRHFVR